MSVFNLVCGVDEAGRGPWAGPVTAAAVILHPDCPIDDLADSKKINPKKRQNLEVIIKSRSAFWAVSHVAPEQIDQLNILQASLLAMKQAIAALSRVPQAILVDGNILPDGLPAPARAIVGGDAREAAISAASILAKTARDRHMAQVCAAHPGYGFSQHKGYGTRAHAAALTALGPCPVHRMSFAPVRLAARKHDGFKYSSLRQEQSC